MRNRRYLVLGGILAVAGLMFANWWTNRPQLTILVNGQPGASVVVEDLLSYTPVRLDRRGTVVASKGYPTPDWVWVQLSDGRNFHLENPTSGQVTYDFYPNGLEKAEASYFLGVFSHVSRSEQVDLTDEQFEAIKSGRKDKFELDRTAARDN